MCWLWVGPPYNKLPLSVPIFGTLMVAGGAVRGAAVAGIAEGKGVADANFGG